MKISIIMPAKNEKESIEKTLIELKKIKIVGEIIIIVDNKKDNTIKIAKKFNCKILIQKKNGYGAAITEGFKAAKNKFGCIFNADYSFNPEELKKFMEASKKNDFIFGSRYLDGAGSLDDDWITFIGNKFFSFICKKFLKIKLSDILYTYVLCNVRKFHSLNLKNNDFKLCIELPFKVSQSNYKYTEIPCYERKRYKGKKKVNNLVDGFYILLEIINSFLKIK